MPNNMIWQEKLNAWLTSKKHERFVIVALVVLYALFLTHNIADPFIGTSEAFNGMYGIAAWNWLRVGAVNLWFTQMTPYNVEPILPEITKNFFINHPQFFIAPAAISYWLFGIGEWQTRLGPIIFSLLSLLIFWAIIKRVFKNPLLAAVSSLFYIFFPMGIYYGRMLTQEPVTMLFVLAFIWATIAFEQERSRKYFYLFCAAAFVGGLMDWQFVFTAAAVWLYIALKKDYPERKKALVLVPTFLFASIGVLMLQITGLTNFTANGFTYHYNLFLARGGVSLFAAFLQKLADLPLFIVVRSMFDFIGFSEIALTLAIFGAVKYISKHKQDKNKLLFAGLIAATGILVYAVMTGHSTAHQFLGFYWIPPVAFFAGWALIRLRRAWFAGLLLILFMGSSLWYANGLFAYKSFAENDFELLKRVNAAVPASEPICMGDNSVNGNVKFYLYPRVFSETPCPTSDTYFVLRRPESYAEKDPSSSLLQSFFTSGFSGNIKRVSFLTATGIEFVKVIPFLKEKVWKLLIVHDPRTGYVEIAQGLRDFIRENKLRAVECATYFCFYEK